MGYLVTFDPQSEPKLKNRCLKLEIDLSPPTRGQRSLSSRCITGFVIYGSALCIHEAAVVVALYSCWLGSGRRFFI